MSIIHRFKDIMSANINALLDKAEDPVKMVDQYLRNLDEDLAKVKSETAAVMAEEKRAKRELDECVEEIAKMQTYAEKALRAGNENDARQFLTKKSVLTEKKNGLQAAYDSAASNAQKMRQMHDKLVQDIAILHSRTDTIKAKMQVAKTQERINEVGSSINGAAANLSAMDALEKKADAMLDKANAMAELNSVQSVESVDDLVMKYEMDAISDVDLELEALKAQMGLTEAE